MAGKLILGSILLVCGAAAYVLYGAFKNSPNYKDLVTDQMKIEFVSYIHLVKKSDQFTVAEEKGVSYSVDIKKPWSFAIHDKTLIIQAPPLDPVPALDVKNQVELQAKTTIKDFALTWLADKFHTKKDLLVEVRF